jgi:hypothetical protein
VNNGESLLELFSVRKGGEGVEDATIGAGDKVNWKKRKKKRKNRVVWRELRKKSSKV